ncbi:MAG: tyrosine-protein phosphatase [Spirochaetaceae bacterium]|jgi:protein-tyrosine phosphatase|nr:tyrosine-protein phosphatase [Spirochaetaceae bacterium]
MKKAIFITALVNAAVIISGCYSEIEADPPEARGGLLPVAGAYNVRDIGIYTTADGEKIKSGKLVRSGDLNLLTERDKKYLFETLGIKTVVDFRSKELTVDDSLKVTCEAKSAQDRLPEGVTVVWEETAINESVIVPDYEAVIGDTYMVADNPYDDRLVIEAVKTGYKRIVVGIPDDDLGDARAQYKKFFLTLLASDPDGDGNPDPVLYHCSAGKDRTGVATALFLSALGIDRETVIQNYLASAENVAEKYYPVGPFIEQTVKDMYQAARALQNQQMAPVVKQKLAESVKPKVAENVINTQVANIPQWGYMLYENKQETAQQIVDSFFQSDEPAQSAIDSAVGGYENRITPLLQIPDINAYAAGAKARVQPLLTVKREYIEAAFTAIEEKCGTVEAYLTDSTNGLGLTSQDIEALKALYLE